MACYRHAVMLMDQHDQLEKWSTERPENFHQNCSSNEDNGNPNHVCVHSWIFSFSSTFEKPNKINYTWRKTMKTCRFEHQSAHVVLHGCLFKNCTTTLKCRCSLGPQKTRSKVLANSVEPQISASTPMIPKVRTCWNMLAQYMSTRKSICKLQVGLSWLLWDEHSSCQYIDIQ